MKKIVIRIGLAALVICGIILTKGDFVISQGMDDVYNDHTVIAKQGDRYGINKSRTNIETDTYKAYFKISGCYTIWEYHSDEDINLDLNYTFHVANAKGKLVFISPDNKVTTLVENIDSDHPLQEGHTSLQVKKGINRIKVVGYKKSALDLILKLDQGKFKK